MRLSLHSTLHICKYSVYNFHLSNSLNKVHTNGAALIERHGHVYVATGISYDIYFVVISSTVFSDLLSKTFIHTRIHDGRTASMFVSEWVKHFHFVKHHQENLNEYTQTLEKKFTPFQWNGGIKWLVKLWYNNSTSGSDTASKNVENQQL